jgi:DNA repair protein RadA/Sms
MKLKTIYICDQCGVSASKWSGQCPNCQAWNSLQEDLIESVSTKQKVNVDLTHSLKPFRFSNNQISEQRLQTKISELDRVLGGGFVTDSLVLLTGDPGIGKSTLALQIAKALALAQRKILYISGEESISQIQSRGLRIGMGSLENFLLLNELVLEKIVATIISEKPDLVIIDSVQVIYSPELGSLAGSITQVRFVTENLMRLAKEQAIGILLIGHVTKDGTTAGPMVLSHLVDAVLYLEGEKYQQFRLLRGTKNRFGPTSEVGVFEMDHQGLKEVLNPSEAFLGGRQLNSLGSSITATLEGTRPFLVELQALTTYTKFGYPKRTCAGIDLNRLHLMIAVLDKYANMKLDSQDVFVNVIGGLKINEPACDLALCMAIVSSKLKKSLPADLLVVGEVGLSGEIRAVTQTERRIKDAQKLGFKKVLMPQSKIDLPDIEFLRVSTVLEAINTIV